MKPDREGQHEPGRREFILGVAKKAAWIGPAIYFMGGLGTNVAYAISCPDGTPKPEDEECP